MVEDDILFTNHKPACVILTLFQFFVHSHNVHYILSVYLFHNIKTLCDHLVLNRVEQCDCLVLTVLKTLKI